jgi:hypothetical protein
MAAEQQELVRRLEEEARAENEKIIKEKAEKARQSFKPANERDKARVKA